MKPLKETPILPIAVMETSVTGMSLTCRTQFLLALSPFSIFILIPILFLVSSFFCFLIQIFLIFSYPRPTNILSIRRTTFLCLLFTSNPYGHASSKIKSASYRPCGRFRNSAVRMKTPRFQPLPSLITIFPYLSLSRTLFSNNLYTYFLTTYGLFF